MPKDFFANFSNNNKVIKFPVEEYEKNFSQKPQEFDLSAIFAYSLGYFGFFLAASEIIKNIIINPSFNHPICHFTYLLSDFEKTSLQKLSQTRKNNIFSQKTHIIGLKKEYFSGKAFICIHSCDEEAIRFTIELKLQRINIQLSKIIDVLFQEVYLKIFRKTKQDKKTYTQKTINHVPEYFAFATAPFIHELRKLMTCDKSQIFIGNANVFAEKTTKNGNFVYKHNYHYESSSQLLEKILEMDDLTVDVFNTLIHLLLQNSDKSDLETLICVDDILFLRTKKQSRNKSGYRGGYKDFQRKEIIKHLEILANIKINVSNVYMPIINENKKRIYSQYSGESPLIYVTKAEQENFFYIRAGELLAMTLQGASTKTGLIHGKIAEYDYYRYFWEKRIGNYLAWLWRNRQNKADFLMPVAVKNLINQISLENNFKRPQLTRNRLEKALDKLENDGIIKSWEYKFINEELLTGKNWFSTWLNLNLIIEPPVKIIEEYSKIRKFGKVQNKENGFYNVIEEVKRKNLSQLAISEEIGIRFENIAKLLSGKLSPNPYEKRKLQNWIKKQKAG